MRVPLSAYYRWLRRKEQQGLQDKGGDGKPPWNKLTSREGYRILSSAREMPMPTGPVVVFPTEVARQQHDYGSE